ncbi:MAG: 1-acyl-sn-glycerol-3-phosphate acyltransferase [Nitriliruptoraceae bacterium]
MQERDEPSVGAAPEVAAALLAELGDLLVELGREELLARVGPDARFEADLELDSLSLAELLVRAEQRFGVRLPEAALATARTPAELLALAGLPAVDAGAATVRPPLAPPGPGGASRRGAPVDGVLRRASSIVYRGWVLLVFSIVAVVVWSLLVVLPTLRWRWQLVRRAGRLLAALAGVPVRIEGTEHLPTDRPFVLVANHDSHLDALLLTQLLEEPAVLTAVAELARNPVLRIGLRRLGAYLVARGDPARGVRDAQALSGIVRSGRTVGFFPEGRRSAAADLEPFRMGAFVVAARTGAPLVPVTLHGTGTVLPPGRWWPQRGAVTVVVAPPLTAGGSGWSGAVELRRAARGIITRQRRELARG